MKTIFGLIWGIAALVCILGCSENTKCAGSECTNETESETDSVTNGDSDSTGSTDSTHSTDSNGTTVPIDTPSDVGVIDMPLEDPPLDGTQDIVYIDPQNGNDSTQDGSIAHPYESFGAVQISDNTIYAVSRGTTMEMDELILRSGITIMSYGEGERPVLHSTVNPPDGANQHAIVTGWGGVSNITIRDVVVECPTATSCIRFGGRDLNNADLQIINVKTQGGTWGIRAFGTRGIRIHNTEVSHTFDDGIFFQADEEIEISNCYVHDVNINWQPPSTPETEAAGDAVQFDSSNHWHVHHNVLDRTNSGNKFCFISNNADQTHGIFEYNTTAGPMPVGGGSSIYFHNGDGLIVRYNTILSPAPMALYSHASNLQIYGNIVVGTDASLYTSVSANVYNNTFYDVAQGLRGGEVAVHNNIFVMRDDVSPVDNITKLTESHNLVVGPHPLENSLTGDPAFVDKENQDFGLNESSAAIDGGIDMGLTHDMQGTTIYQGSAPDIGALEYVE